MPASIKSQSKRGRKRTRIIGLLLHDALMLVIAFIIALALRLHSTTPLAEDLSRFWRIIPVSILFVLPILILTNTYLDLTRYATSVSFYRFAIRSALMMIVVSQIYRFFEPQPHLSFWFLFWVLFLGYSVASRVVIRDVLKNHVDQVRSCWSTSEVGAFY
jgi:FlaA1/EpsC-like NDP-sugar epimerase